MINDCKRWLYSKTEEAKIFDAGDEIKGQWYDSPDFDSPETNMFGDEPKISKYPSQMNKDELAEFGTDIGISFDQAMTKREMLEAINEKIKSGSGE